MVNLLGEPGHTGPAHYEGLGTLLAMPGVSPFFYGKAQTRPGRKMGHITVLDDSVDGLREKAEMVKKNIRVVTV